MAIWFAQLSVDRWRRSNAIKRGEGADIQPTALVTETAHGPRIHALNDAARAAGAQIGTMLADARTICPDIVAAPADHAGDLDFLEKLALWSQRWGPWSALDAPDGVLVDVTGAAHLLGGEDRLLEDVSASFAARQLITRSAIAATAGAAWALAHFGRSKMVADAIIAPQDDPMRHLSDLPAAALRLDENVITVLRRLGLKQMKHVYAVARGHNIDDSQRHGRERDENGRSHEKIGRDALKRRFRSKSPTANPLIRIDQLLGYVPEPMLPVIAQPMAMVQRRLMEPIRHRTLLDQVLADLADDMVRTLEGRGEGARRLELGLWRVDGEVTIRTLEMAAATRDPHHITRLFTNKLNDIDAGFGIELVRLRATWAAPLGLAQGDIEAASEQRGTSLSVCLDRLTVRLGKQAVQKPVQRASHIPERAQSWQPPLDADAPSQQLLEFHKRPLKMLDRAEEIVILDASSNGHPERFRWRGKIHEVARVEGPERIAPEWWRERSTVRLRDYYRVEDSNGSRYWIYRNGVADDGRGGAPLWYLQGLYA